MTIETITESYKKMAEELKAAGASLNESQDQAVNSFIENIKTLVNETKEQTIKETEDKLQEEYTGVVESIVEGVKENNKLQNMVAEKQDNMADSENLVDAVNSYLKECISKAIPSKLVVDYKQLNTYKKIFENLKETLGVNAALLTDKVTEAENKYIAESTEMNKKIEVLESKLNDAQTKLIESVENNTKLTKKLNEAKIEIKIEKAAEDLTPHQTDLLKARLAGVKLDDIDAKLPDAIKEIQDQEKTNLDNEQAQVVTSVNEEIKGIISGGSKKPSKTDLTVSSGKADSSKKESVNDDVLNESYDDCELGSDEQINESVMKEWIRLTEAIDPIR